MENNYENGQIGMSFVVKGSLSELGTNHSLIVNEIANIARPREIEFETTPDEQNTNIRISFTPTRAGIPGEIIERLQQNQCPILYLEKKNHPTHWPKK
jgi:hypothetical protein